MKKMILLLILSISLLSLAGCGSTKTAYNLEYVDTINTEITTTVVFKDKTGEIVGFNLENSDKLFLTKGNKYNVEYTVSDFSTYGQFIANVKPSK